MLQRRAHTVGACSPQMIGHGFTETRQCGQVGAPQRYVATRGPHELTHWRGRIVRDSDPQRMEPRALIVHWQWNRHGNRLIVNNDRGELIIVAPSPDGYREISRTQLIQPTTGQLSDRGGVCWAHHAFAYKHVFARNDEELVCASLEAPAGH